MTTVFFNETALNGKFQVMANIELEMKGIKKVGSGNIITHAGEIYKGLFNYWVSSKALEAIKITLSPIRTCF